MSEPKEKPRALLLISVMFSKKIIDEKSNEYYKRLLKILKKKFGVIIKETDFFEFNYTNYYEKEFGDNLIKKYLCFGFFDIEKLPEVKHFCYKIEKKFSNEGKRLFNIDCGYLKENALILASFKERAHRIYLKKKVYADLQIVYENNSWKEFKWSFMDIKTNLSFFEVIREILKERKNLKN